LLGLFARKPAFNLNWPTNCAVATLCDRIADLSAITTRSLLFGPGDELCFDFTAKPASAFD
jgi:hypothetical protein